jgi:hypothetical protein
MSEETVNHPKHYNHGTIEAIDVIEDWNLGFHLGTALKYISRCGHKGDEADAVQDLQKAVWYLEREIKRRCRSIPNPDWRPVADLASAIAELNNAKCGRCDNTGFIEISDGFKGCLLCRDCARKDGWTEEAIDEVLANKAGKP